MTKQLYDFIAITPRGFLKGNQFFEAESSKDAAQKTGKISLGVDSIVIPRGSVPDFTSLESYRMFHALIPGMTNGTSNADKMLQIIGTVILDFEAQRKRQNEQSN